MDIQASLGPRHLSVHGASGPAARAARPVSAEAVRPVPTTADLAWFDTRIDFRSKDRELLGASSAYSSAALADRNGRMAADRTVPQHGRAPSGEAPRPAPDHGTMTPLDAKIHAAPDRTAGTVDPLAISGLGKARLPGSTSMAEIGYSAAARVLSGGDTEAASRTSTARPIPTAPALASGVLGQIHWVA